MTFWRLVGNFFGDFMVIFLATFWRFLLDDFLATVWRLVGNFFGDFMVILLATFWRFFGVTLWWLLGVVPSEATPLLRLFDHFLGTIWRLFWWMFAAFWPLYGDFFPQFSTCAQATWQVNASKVVQTRVLTHTVDGRSPADMVNISVFAERFIHVRWFFEISEPSTVRKAFRLGTFEDKFVP